jgi:hypothetical protein
MAAANRAKKPSITFWAELPISALPSFMMPPSAPPTARKFSAVPSAASARVIWAAPCAMPSTPPRPLPDSV